MSTTRIEWADVAVNPLTGCTPYTEGCDRCYAKRMAQRLAGRYGYPLSDPFRPGVFHPERLSEISHAKADKRIFVGSMADMFHEQVNIRGPELADVFRAVAYSEATCLFLTKRARRMKDAVQFLYGTSTEEFRLNLTCQDEPPLKNLWLGVSVELQKYATRIERLRETPAALRFVSVEPMLGRINLRPFLPGVSWVICGPETGMKPRPMEISWARDLRDQCQKAGVAFFYKPQTAPEDLRIQEFPV